MNYTELISQILLIISMLTALVKIVTEVAKKSFDWVQGSKVINGFVLVLSLILTVAVFTAYWQIKQMELAWYIIAAFIIIGFLVAYAAMFGYDKLLSYFKKEA